MRLEAHQTAYVRKALKRFKLENVGLKEIPLASSTQVVEKGENVEPKMLTYY